MRSVKGRTDRFVLKQTLRQLLRWFLHDLDRLVDLYDGEEVYFDPLEREELIRLGLAYPDPNSKAGVVLSNGVWGLIREVDERESRAVKAPNVGYFLQEKYLVPLEMGRDAARESEGELALDYYRMAMRSVGELRALTLQFERKIEGVSIELERDLSVHGLVPWYTRLINLQKEFVEQFRGVLSALGKWEGRRDRILCQEIAQALADQYPEEAEAVRSGWLLMAHALMELYRMVRRRLDALSQRRRELDEAKRFREAVWKGAKRAIEEGVLEEILGAGIWTVAIHPFPGVWSERLLKEIPPRKERTVTLGEVPPFDWEEEPSKAQRTIEEFFTQKEEKSFVAWASRRGYTESALALLLLSILLDPRWEGRYVEVGGETYVEDVLLDAEEEVEPSYRSEEELGEEGVLLPEGGGEGAPSPRA